MSDIDPLSFQRTLDAALSNYILLLNETESGNGASADSTINLGIVPFKKWRVVEIGFHVMTNGTSTIAELIHFGIGLSDIGAADTDFFGICTQDVTAAKQLAAGDMVSRAGLSQLNTLDAPANAGTHSWTAGSPDGFKVWQTKAAGITATKKTVASSTATIMTWALVEIDKLSKIP